MAKLNDTQTFILSAASQEADGSLYPLPDTLAAGGARVTRAVVGLVSAGFAAERETSTEARIHRRDGDIGFGLFVTPAGLAAIGVDDGDDPAAAADADAPPSASVPPAPARTTRAAAVLALLERNDGATLPEIIAATGWLPHTTRAALTGLRKKGHLVERFRRDDVTCYRIGGAA